MNKIKLVIIDDSNIIHALLNKILRSFDDIEITGNAKNALQGIEIVKSNSPDIIIMDITMPGMSGLEAIETIMDEKPTPIIVFSAASKKIINLSFKAIDLGAVDIIEKPEAESISDLQKIIEAKLVQSIRTFSDIKVVRRVRREKNPLYHKDNHELNRLNQTHKKTDQKIQSSILGNEEEYTPNKNDKFLLVGIAASTGGPQTVKQLLTTVSHKQAPCSYIIVQHMAMGFIKGFSDWINCDSSIPVEIAQDQSFIHPERIYVAPEGYHLIINEKQQFEYIDSPPIFGIRPAADLLFDSLGEVFKKRAIAIVLTGMGRDGSKGLKSIKTNGGYIIAQDEASSYIFGMPKAAIETGLTDKILSIYEMPNYLETLYKDRYNK